MENVRDYSEVHATVERSIGNAYSATRGFITSNDRAEVEDFLRAGEYGLALEALTAALVEDQLPITESVLKDLDTAAAAMDLGQEDYMLELHSAVFRQRHHVR